MKVIALSGYKQSGKDTVASYLCEKHDFFQVSFAGPLKDMVSKYFDIPRSSMDDSNLKEKPLLEYPVPAVDSFTKTVSEFMVREFRTCNGFSADVKYVRAKDGILQTFTNDWENLYHTPRSLAILMGSSMRSGTSDFWVKRAIEQMQQSKGRVVISDLRFNSEMKQLKEVFGNNLVTIRINRYDTSPSSDPSERDLDNANFDFVVLNKGTKEELFNKIDGIIVKA